MFFGGSITLENKGYIDILEFKISRKDANITAVDAPIVACRADDTILKSKLPEALLPGEELQLYIIFYEKISTLAINDDMRGNQYDFDQQHPKLVVYDQNGWHQDHCHADGEYYGKFGTFNVTISLPCNCIVCTTGVPGEGDPGWFWIEFDTSLSDQER